MRYALSVLVAGLALVACDGFAPVTVGTPYLLRTVNGQPLPWSTPSSDSSHTPATITEGWVTLLDRTRAERHERIGRWVMAANGIDSLWIGSVWTEGAIYERRSNTIILTYETSAFEWFIPPQPAETLYVTPRGGLMLRLTGLVPPLDSVIKVYCTTSSC
jgi:hypothetical protein